jgi:hypothetical protein
MAVWATAPDETMDGKDSRQNQGSDPREFLKNGAARLVGYRAEKLCPGR